MASHSFVYYGKTRRGTRPEFVPGPSVQWVVGFLANRGFSLIVENSLLTTVAALILSEMADTRQRVKTSLFLSGQRSRQYRQIPRQTRQ
jgi:hypothetical protein